MTERFAVQMSPTKEQKMRIFRVYKKHGFKLAGRVLKLILDDIKKLENAEE